MKILGIDTSCDDTAIGLLEIKNSQIKILANLISSQIKIHRPYGGVYPFLAKREHQKNLPLVFKRILKKTNLKIKDIDLIAVTIGPGLEPCLWTGINFAKELSQKFKISLIPVNHIEAHILANFIGDYFPLLINQPQNLFPAVCLIVSGGHTQLILMKRIGQYQLLGETRDDAAGECLDKTARILGLGYPGGPAIAQQAKIKKQQIQSYKSQINLKLQTTNEFKISLPRPMIKQKNYDFSFSGLKTAVLYHYQQQPVKIKKSLSYIQAMAKEIQQAIIDVLLIKTIKAVKDFQVKTIILGGGVAANEELRRQFKKNFSYPYQLFIPSKELCTDNGLMVSLTGYFVRQRLKKRKYPIEAQANLKL